MASQTSDPGQSHFRPWPVTFSDPCYQTCAATALPRVPPGMATSPCHAGLVESKGLCWCSGRACAGQTSDPCQSHFRPLPVTFRSLPSAQIVEFVSSQLVSASSWSMPVRLQILASHTSGPCQSPSDPCQSHPKSLPVTVVVVDTMRGVLAKMAQGFSPCPSRLGGVYGQICSTLPLLRALHPLATRTRSSMARSRRRVCCPGIG